MDVRRCAACSCAKVPHVWHVPHMYVKRHPFDKMLLRRICMQHVWHVLHVHVLRCNVCGMCCMLRLSSYVCTKTYPFKKDATRVACAAYVCQKTYPFKGMLHIWDVLHMCAACVARATYSCTKTYPFDTRCNMCGVCRICMQRVCYAPHIHVQRCGMCGVCCVSMWRAATRVACAAYPCENIQMCGVCCVKRCMHVKGGGWHVPCIDVQRIDPLKESSHEY